MLAVWGLAARLLSRPGQLQANVMVGPVLTHQKSPLPAKQWLPGLIRITHPRDRLSRCCGVQVTEAEWVAAALCSDSAVGSGGPLTLFHLGILGYAYLCAGSTRDEGVRGSGDRRSHNRADDEQPHLSERGAAREPGDSE
jgi:hypothetical protein